MANVQWHDAVVEDLKSSGGEGKFLRFGDGDRHVLALIGEPMKRQIVFDSGKSHEFDPDVHHGLRPTTKYLFNAYLVDEDRVVIWEMSRTTMKALVKITGKFSPGTWCYEVLREGDGLTTQYSVTPERELTKAELGAIADAVEHDLAEVGGVSLDAPEKKAKPDLRGVQNLGGAANDDDIPFGPVDGSVW